MNLGPSKLNPTHRIILRRKYNKLLQKKYHRGKIQWADKSLTGLKNELRIALRGQQNGRCYFCRRIILIERKNVYESIEHYLDKSKKHYRRWTFSPVNITVCCHACNFQKSTIDLGDNSIRISEALCSTSGSFRWLHPYFDNYHDNIEIKDGWVFSVKAGAPRAEQARALIADCQLDKIESIEARRSELSKYKMRVLAIVGRALFNGNQERALRFLSHASQIEQDSWKF